MYMLVIGDIHGNTYKYAEIIGKTEEETIQVGDFGFSKTHEWHLKNIDPQKHKINFGNHDDYKYLPKRHSLHNFSVSWPFKGVMTIRGADSIDKYWRTEGVNWWKNEELSYSEMKDAVRCYEREKPEIVVTHDCPQEIRELFFKIKDKTPTSFGLQHMFEFHQPKLWLFGHHHSSKDQTVNGTRFICLAEFETFLI